MGKRRQSVIIAAILFAAILVPSAQFMWRNHDMPDFADLHDDGILFVSAKSIADGQGYRIPSFPSRPFQTKYPPLYPLLLAVVWKLNPNFPQNLVLASAGSWLLLVVCVALALVFYGTESSVKKYKWWMTAMLGLCPYMVLFGARMFSEIAFTCLALGALLCMKRSEARWIACAGFLAAAAYLTRTAGLALILACLVWLVVKRDWRGAAIFTAPAAPAILGWSVWTRSHLIPSTDPQLLYYLDYLGFQRLNVGWDNLSLVLWKNVDQILYAMGSLVLPKVMDSLPVKILTQVIAVAMISGVVRLWRRESCRLYALFAIMSCAILAVWHFPPNERFVLPLYPLLLAGLFTEMEHLAGMLWGAFRKRSWGDRIVAAGFGGAVACLLAAAIGLQFFVTFVMMPEAARQKRARLERRIQAYRWMDAHLPKDAAVLSYDDPLLFLYTGRVGAYNPMLTRYWYTQDHQKMIDSYRDLGLLCRRKGLSFVYISPEDEDSKAIANLIQHDSNLQALPSLGSGTVFRVVANQDNRTASSQPAVKQPPLQ
jgi:hypothetical protein